MPALKALRASAHLRSQSSNLVCLNQAHKWALRTNERCAALPRTVPPPGFLLSTVLFGDAAKVFAGTADTSFVISSASRFVPSAVTSHVSNSLAGTRYKTLVSRIPPMLLEVLSLCIPALSVARAPAIGDPDIWWHLRAGEWIVQNHAIPHTDMFCQMTLGRPWAAYSWLFEVILFLLFHSFGLVGIITYTIAIVLAITFTLRKLVQRSLNDAPLAIAATFLLCLSMGHLFTPRPWLFSILFFAIELNLLQKLRETGLFRHLLCLPPLFALWANIHVQYIDGLLVLGLFCVDNLVTSMRKRNQPSPQTWPSFGILALSLLATLCNPYGWHLYRIAWDLTSEPGVLNQLQELQSVPFRDCVDWLILATALAVTLVLAKQRTPSLFEGGLFIFGCACAFRSQRDVWILTVAAASILPSGLARLRSRRGGEVAATPQMLTVLVSLVLVFSICTCLGLSNRALQERLNKTMPVAAVEQVKRLKYPGDVFNDYAWGGYLIWDLRKPVSLDGRAGLHGEQRIKQSITTWSAGEGWTNDSQLANCGYVIAPRQAPLAQLLRLNAHFQLVYEDQIATVFLRK